MKRIASFIKPEVISRYKNMYCPCNCRFEEIKIKIIIIIWAYPLGKIKKRG